MTALEVFELSKHFGGLRALDGVSLAVDAGEIVGLIGPNGSGKSTLLNAVSGVHTPTGGSVRVMDEETAGWPAHRIAGLGLARTFQQPRLLAQASVYFNVLVATHTGGRHGFFGALVGGRVTRSEEQLLARRAWDALELVGLADRAHVLASQLTAGETRLVGVARAVAAAAKVLLLDEPAAGLNSAETDSLRAKLLELRDRGVAIVLVDHDMTLVMHVASRVVVLDHGVVISSGSPAEIQADAAVIEAYLGRRAAEELATRQVS